VTTRQQGIAEVAVRDLGQLGQTPTVILRDLRNQRQSVVTTGRARASINSSSQTRHPQTHGGENEYVLNQC
jgi:hypothetical protein